MIFVKTLSGVRRELAWRDSFLDAEDLPDEGEDVVLHLFEVEVGLVELEFEWEKADSLEAVVDVEELLHD